MELEESYEETLVKKPSNTAQYVAVVMIWLNVVTAAALMVYDFVFFSGPSYQVLQFIQIEFISLLLLLLNSSATQVPFRICIVLAIAALQCVWCYSLAVLWSREFNLGTVFFVMVFICGITWGMSITYACFISRRTNKESEFDLILYLASLNAVCCFSPASTLNNALHLLLDIRTFVLVYTYLHDVPKKEDLLGNITFMAVVILSIISFIMTAVIYSDAISHNEEVFATFVFVIFLSIGLLLQWECYIVGLRTASNPAASNF